MVVLIENLVLSEDPNGLPRFRMVQTSDHHKLLNDLGEHLKVERSNSGNLNYGNSNTVLKKVVSYFYNKLHKLVATFDADELLTRLVAYDETNTRELVNREVMFAKRLSCFGDHGEPLKEMIRNTAAQTAASIGNRFLVEYVVAQPPNGTQRLSLESYDSLLAIAGEINYWGSLSEFLYFKLVDLEIDMLPSGRLGFDNPAFESALRNFTENYVGRQSTKSGDALIYGRSDRNWEQVETSETPTDIEIFDEAFAVEFGFLLTELIDLMAAVCRLGSEQKGPVKQLPADRMAGALARSLEWEKDKVIRGLDLLTLAPRNDFLKPPGGSAADTYPWRFNRAWSYLRRPLLRRGWESDSPIIWGNRHVLFTVQHVTDLCYSGRIKAEKTSLKRVVSKRQEMEAKAFEKSVRLLVTELTGIEAKGRLRKVGGRRIATGGADLGDIDVLGVIPSQRVILCIECKALAMARTPAEIQHQVDELTGRDGKPGTVQKHQRRVGWVEEHLDEVLKQCFNIDRKGRWSVKPLLVSDRELFAPHIRRIPFPAWSLETLGRMTAHKIARGL